MIDPWFGIQWAFPLVKKGTQESRLPFSKTHGSLLQLRFLNRDVEHEQLKSSVKEAEVPHGKTQGVYGARLHWSENNEVSKQWEKEKAHCFFIVLRIILFL